MLHGFISRDGSLALWAETDHGRPDPETALVADPDPGSARRGMRGSVPGHGRRRCGSAGPARASTLLLPVDVGAGRCLAAARAGAPARAAQAAALEVPAVTVPFVTDDLADEFGGRPAPSVTYLAEVCAFAADLVARGRVLPGVLHGRAAAAAPSGGPCSPVPTPPGTPICCARMPPACRAERSRPGDVDGLPAADTLHAALYRLVDGLVRTRLAEADVHLTGATWLAALSGEPEFEPSPVSWTRSPTPSTTGMPRPAAVPPSGSASGSATCPSSRRTSPTPPAPPSRTGDGDAWLLEFLLQPLDEPSLLVTAADVWRDRSAPLRRWTHHPQERLLAGLGRARAALRRPRCRPARGPARRAGARHRGRAPVPEPRRRARTGRVRRAAARLVAGAAAARAGARGAGRATRSPRCCGTRPPTWHASSGTTGGSRSAGGCSPRTELADLARVKVPLVRLRGRWVYLDPERLAGRAGVPAARRRHDDRRGRVAAGPAAAARGVAAAGHRRPGARAGSPTCCPGGWRSGSSCSTRPRGWSASCGRTRAGVLPGWPFSTVWGWAPAWPTTWAWARPCSCWRCCCIAGAGPTLLICPLSVLGNWQREAARFAPSLRVRVLHGADRPEPGRLLDGADVVLTTYATATRDADALAAVAWDRVVLDEAQHIKNSASGAAQAVRRFPARHRVALTGTPVENRLAELWSILDFLNPGLLGSRAHVPRPVRRPDRAVRRRGRRRPAAPRHPAVHAAPGQVATRRSSTTCPTSGTPGTCAG